MTVLLSAIIPVSLIILVGFMAEKALKLEKQTLSQLTVYVLSPALIVDSLYRTTLSTQSTTGLVTGFTVTSLLLYLTVWGLSRILNLTPLLQKSLIASTLFPNTGNLGLPLSTFAFGAAGLERAVVYLIASSILISGVGPALLTGGSLGSGVRLALKLPLSWAILAGLLLRLLAIKLPLGLDLGIQQLGMAAIPVALLVLGTQLASTRLSIGSYEACTALIRLILAPLIAYSVGQVLPLSTLDLQVLVLQSAMPTAVNSVVLVHEFGGDAPRVARTVVVSTLLGFITLPLVLWAITGS